MHKRFSLALVVALIVTGALDSYATPAPAVAPTQATVAVARPRIQVLFSPAGGCTDAILDAIGKAKTSIDVQAYSFTSAPIAKAVAEAHARGVKVRVVLDKSQRTERYTSATFLYNNDVAVWIDAKHAIAHNKIILIDGAIILTGSFNFTKSAEERNAENLLIIEGHPELVASYQSNFEEHLQHSTRYVGLEPKPAIAPTPPAAEPAAADKPAARKPRKAA
jgi:phosphatidylserine/phosphatidylglycerophosphate/cardiolipin synthase-like enzyme